MSTPRSVRVVLLVALAVVMAAAGPPPAAAQDGFRFDTLTAQEWMYLREGGFGPMQDAHDRQMARYGDLIIDAEQRNASSEVDRWRAARDAERARFLDRSADIVARRTVLAMIIGALSGHADELDPGAPPPPDDASLDALRAVDDADLVENAIDTMVAFDALTVPGGAVTIDRVSSTPYQLGAGLASGALPPADAEVFPDAPRRPVRFVVDGVRAVTVRVGEYQPGSKATGASAPSSSTVVFPGGGSSALLELPVGIYTFCYDWELGDVDRDGSTDYRRRTTGSVSLTTAAPTGDAAAKTVNLAVGGSTTPNGRCGQPVTTSDEPTTTSTGDAAGATTAAERANAGLHTYALSCVWDDGTAGEDVVVTISLDFSADALTVGGPSANDFFGLDSLTLARTGPNAFAAATEEYAADVALTRAGASVVIDYGDFWGVLSCNLARTS